MTNPKPRYCMDTSALIAAWNERYPIDIFPQIWDGFRRLINEGRLIIPQEVAIELDVASEELGAWLAEVGDCIVPTDQHTIDHVSAVLRSHARLAAERKHATSADAFVVSLAKLRGAVVVTEEAFGTAGKPKIPLVCSAYSITSISLLDLIKAEGAIMSGRPRNVFD